MAARGQLEEVVARALVVGGVAMAGGAFTATSWCAIATLEASCWSFAYKEEESGRFKKDEKIQPAFRG